MKSICLPLLTSLLAAMTVPPAGHAVASSVTRTVSYFNVGGTTIGEIEDDLTRRGPQIANAGPRHPGATRMEFTTRVTYGESGGRCMVMDATVDLAANMILPRWRVTSKAEGDVRLVWDTLAADIRRHEESHIVIARNHAREMEVEIGKIRNQPDCDSAAKVAQDINARILEKHDREQARFDRIETINFESRMIRLLRNRLDRMERQADPG